MADLEQPTPIEGTPAPDVEMGEEAAVNAAENEEGTAMTELEPEEPKLVLFAE